MALAFLVAGLAIYTPAISAPFVYDDLSLPFLVSGYEKESFGAWVSGLRPVLMASYWINFKMGGLDTTLYHALNILLHIGNSLLVALAIRKLAGGASATILGAFCGALFLVHPLQTEAVSYVASRSENLTVFLYFSAFVLFLYRHTAKIDWPTAAGVLALFGAACLSKEYAVTLPVLILLADLYFGDGGGVSSVKGNWKLYAPIAIVGAGGLAFILNMLRGADTIGFNLAGLSPQAYFFTQCRAIWIYIAKFLLPIGLNVDHDFPISQGPMDHGAVFGLIGLLVVSAAAFWYRKQFPLASFGWFAFLLLLAPTSSFVPIRDVLVERRVYLPSIGLLLIAAEGLRRIRVPHFAQASILLVLCVLTWQRNTLWADPLELWRDAAEKSPNKWRVQFQVADALYRKGDCAQSAAVYEKTHTLAKPDYRLLVNWATSLDCAGQTDAALQRAQQALDIERSGQALAMKGMFLAKQNKLDEAMQSLNEAIQLSPRFDPAFLFRGNVHSMQGNLEKAAADYQAALAINPSNAQAARGLARVTNRR
jgi:protein O-mannosyl-transferase